MVNRKRNKKPNFKFKLYSFYRDIESISKENQAKRAKRKEEFMSRLDFVGDGSLETINKDKKTMRNNKIHLHDDVEDLVESDLIYFTRLRKVKCPRRACNNDAGIDFFMPLLKPSDITKYHHCLFNTNLLGEIDSIVIKPNGRVSIPSGIRVWIVDKGTCLLAKNKSGMATNNGLIFTAEVVDADYTGEIHIGLANLGDKPVTLNMATYSNNKGLIQFLHTPYIKSVLLETTDEAYDRLSNGSDRGFNGMGSGISTEKL